MPGKVALIIVFNHRYDKNIEKLESIYNSRFSSIFYLVPFYNGSQPNVIPVYESSFYFQGYFAQGFKYFFNKDFLHYIFIGDDLLLNPAINEHNYAEYFCLDAHSCFIPEIYTLNKVNNNSTLNVFPARLSDKLFHKGSDSIDKWFWTRALEAYQYKPIKNGIESCNEMPSYSEALTKIQNHGYQIQPLEFIDLFGGLSFPVSIRKIRKNVLYLIHQILFRKKYYLKYPLVGSYSDVVIVSRKSIEKFIHYCGVFAAQELFVEHALPTALLLASEKVVTEPSISKRGLVYWDSQVLENDLKKYAHKLKNLLTEFPQGKLYVHPVKLSKWN